MKTLPSTSGYLIRAIYEWCCDSSQTPYISVRVSSKARVPLEHIRNGEIVLNIDSGATRDLRIDNDAITFSARFNSVSHEIFIPVSDVKGIFARESGQGMSFNVLDEMSDSEEQASGEGQKISSDLDSSGKSVGRDRLKLVR